MTTVARCRDSEYKRFILHNFQLLSNVKISNIIITNNTMLAWGGVAVCAWYLDMKRRKSNAGATLFRLDYCKLTICFLYLQFESDMFL